MTTTTERETLAQLGNTIWRKQAQEAEPDMSVGQMLGEFFAPYRVPEWSDTTKVELIHRAGLPSRHRRAGLRTDENAPDGWRQTRDRIVNKTGSGYLVALLGPRGTGKTQMAEQVVMANAMTRLSGAYVKAMEVFLTIRATFGDDSDYTELDAIAQFIRPHVLVIDEIQERGETAWEDRLLTYIIDKRYDAMRDTVLIGNLEPDAFRESLGPSIVDRLIETGGIVRCDWPSFRAKSGTGPAKGATQ